MDLKAIIDEINSQENIGRKLESFKRNEIYNNRLGPFLEDALSKEYTNKETVRIMRKIKSINFTQRLVKNRATLYRDQPEREFVGMSDTTEINKIYDGLNKSFHSANRKYVFENQCGLLILPNKNREITMRVLLPHHFDVVPNKDNPEIADGIVINMVEYDQYYNDDQTGNVPVAPFVGDRRNQSIADVNDNQKAQQRYAWYFSDRMFVTDGNGNIVSDILPSPLLPFVDVSDEKEFEFWVKQGSSICDFALDFSVLLSDTAEINKMQGFSVPVLASEEAPTSMEVGPRKILWLKTREDGPETSFGFENPSPDLDASLALLDKYLDYFFAANGVSAKEFSKDGVQYTSGFDRLLAKIEKYEATKDDETLFKEVEQKVFEVVRAWYNLLNTSQISDSVELVVNYAKPQIVQSKKEIIEIEEKKLNLNLTDRASALAEIESIPLGVAQERIEALDVNKAQTVQV